MPKVDHGLDEAKSLTGGLAASSSKSRRFPQAASLIWGILLMTNATSVIPESYTLMKDMGQGAVASGWVIGCGWALQALTVAAMQCFAQKLSYAGKRALIVVAALVFAASNLAFAVAADPPGWWHDPSDGKRLVCIILARLAAGPCAGVGLFITALSVDITPRSEMVPYSVWRMCGATVGVGFGPILSSASQHILNANGVRARAAAPGYVLAFVYVAFAVVLCSWLPMDLEPLLEAKREEDDAKSQAGTQKAAQEFEVADLSTATRVKLWKSGLYYGVERAFIVSMLESATAFVLQQEFGWSTRDSGYAVGIAFLGSVPLTLAANVVKQRGWTTDLGLMFASVLVCAASTVLLFPQLAFASGVYILLVADGLIFSTGYLANGVFTGLALKSSMPGTKYTVDNYIFIGEALQNTCARLLAPAIARLVLDDYGRGVYAAFQLATSVLGFVTCVSVRRSILADRDAARISLPHAQSGPERLPNS
mmetsp:Transcript_17861/g.46024  ORF Transcript_17861/g.46024 Transcript_17861/m.46024 type:complete len:481 (+) Transcript_17861:65-1507(+)